MPRIKTIALSEQQRKDLEKGFKYGTTPSYRLRCRALLLKSEKRTSLTIAQELGCCEVAINNWMRRFTEQGMDGLKVAKGRGRKAVLQSPTDLEAVRRAVQSSRQRMGLVKADLEKELEKEFSQLTLRRFVKKMVDAVGNKFPPLQTHSTGDNREAQCGCVCVETRMFVRPRKASRARAY